MDGVPALTQYCLVEVGFWLLTFMENVPSSAGGIHEEIVFPHNRKLKYKTI